MSGRSHFIMVLSSSAGFASFPNTQQKDKPLGKLIRIPAAEVKKTPLAYAMREEKQSTNTIRFAECGPRGTEIQTKCGSETGTLSGGKTAEMAKV